MKTLISCAALTAASFAGVASADLVDIRYDGLGASRTVTVTSPGYSGGVHAGQIRVTASNSQDPSRLADGSYTVFCCDLFQFVNGSFKPYSIVDLSVMPDASPMGASKAAAIADLYSRAAGRQFGSDADYACAFQLAVWETVFDFNTLRDVNGGLFSASGYNAAVGSYLSDLFAASGNGGTADLVGVQSASYQDFVVQVPAPGSFALLAAAGIFGRGRRRDD